MARLTLLLFITFFATAAPLNDFDDRLAAFYHPFDKWLRSYQGCPPEGYDDSACNRSQSRQDLKSFAKARHAAAALFGLRE